MDKRLVRRIVLALVAMSSVAAVLASGGVAAPRRHAVTPSPRASGVHGGIRALRAEHRLATGGVAAPQRPAVALSPLEGDVLADINALRAGHRLAPLRLSSSLSAAARAH